MPIAPTPLLVAGDVVPAGNGIVGVAQLPGAQGKLKICDTGLGSAVKLDSTVAKRTQATLVYTAGYHR